MRRWVTSPSYDVVVQTLVAARQAAGVSQAELAKRLGKPPSYVAKIELKERRVDVVEFVEFLDATGTDTGSALTELLRLLSNRRQSTPD
jgi:transcriptional regulator with XRE-family HTH domain